MKAMGNKPVQIWLDPKELELISAAAKASYKPLAMWIRKAAFDAASQQLGYKTIGRAYMERPNA